MNAPERGEGASACRLRVKFARSGPAAGLSHLEQIKALRKIAQDSGLPLALTGAKRAQARMSFGPAIAVGYRSGAEYADIFLSEPRAASEAEAMLSRASGGGFSVLETRRIPLGFPSVEALVNVAEYEIEGDFSGAPRAVEEFLARKEIVVEKVKPSGTRELIDAKALIVAMRREGAALRLVLRFGPKRTLKPERILQEWLERPVCPEASGFSIIRKQLYWEDAQGQLNAP